MTRKILSKWSYEWCVLGWPKMCQAYCLSPSFKFNHKYWLKWNGMTSVIERMDLSSILGNSFWERKLSLLPFGGRSTASGWRRQIGGRQPRFRWKFWYKLSQAFFGQVFLKFCLLHIKRSRSCPYLVGLLRGIIEGNHRKSHQLVSVVTGPMKRSILVSLLYMKKVILFTVFIFS